jgi:hypothetical protein
MALVSPLQPLNITINAIMNSTTIASTRPPVRRRRQKEKDMAFILGAIYIVLLITLGIMSLRKGHWVMFIIGLFIPLFWIIGALMPSRARLSR